MSRSDIADIARATGIAESAISLWRLSYGRKALRKCHSRPQGTLAMIDIASKYHVPYGRIVRWRKAGLKFRKAGPLLVIQEKALLEWLKNYYRAESNAYVLPDDQT